MSTDSRQQALMQWLQQVAGVEVQGMTPAAGDASFRRYFRVQAPETTFIAMDSPPEREDPTPFVLVDRALAAMGLNVPEILEADLERGYLLLSDLGQRLYLDELTLANGSQLYGDALEALSLLHQAAVDDAPLPPFDRTRLEDEMALFQDWLLKRHLGVTLSAEEQASLERVFEDLTANALAQPQVWVHRDYHSRNLMVIPRQNPGILDFQDAVVGPLTYDLVSLLKDCYIRWPRPQVIQWAQGYQRLAESRGLMTPVSSDTFLRWFDLMGVQRHLKASGIFARLYHRDGKPGYLRDIPRTLGYIQELTGLYNELEPLLSLLNERVIPRLSS